MGKCLRLIPVCVLLAMLLFPGNALADGNSTVAAETASGEVPASEDAQPLDSTASEDAQPLDSTAAGNHIGKYTVNDATWDWDNKTWDLKSYTMDGVEAFCVQFGTDMDTGEDAYWCSSVDTSDGAKNIARVKFFTDMYGESLYGLDSVQRTWVVQRYCWESGYNIESGSNTWRLNYDEGFTDSIFDELVECALNMNSTGSVAIYVAGTGIQDLGVVSYKYGTAELIKGGKVGSYSLAKALYKIYNTQGGWTGIAIITDENGQGYLARKYAKEPKKGLRVYDSELKCWWKSTGTTEISLTPGKYTTKEVEKPESEAYLINESTVKFTVKADKSVQVNCTEKTNVADVSISKKGKGSKKFLAQFSENRMYSQDYSGAEFSVKVNQKTLQVTTGEDGTAKISDLIKGSSLIITETKAPLGFVLPSESRKTGTVGDSEFVFSDTPAMAASPFKIIKCVECNGKQDLDSVVKGVVFKVEYYDSLEKIKKSESALRTWYFASDEKGEICYGKSWLSKKYESDSLYYNSDSKPALPLGTIVVSEVYCSSEYKLWTGKLVGKVKQESSGAEATFAWDSAKNDSSEAGESIGIIDSTYQATVANAVKISMPLTGENGVWPIIMAGLGLLAGSAGVAILLGKKNIAAIVAAIAVIIIGMPVFQANADENVKTELPTITKEVDHADAYAGEILNYVVTCTLPEIYEKFSTYELIVTDVWDEGIDIVRDSITVKTGAGKDIGEAAEISWDDGSFRVRFDNLKQVVFEREKIIITYQGSLNLNASTGKISNDNKAYITYTKSPQSTELAQSTECVARVFCWQMDIKIISTDGATLETSFTAQDEEGYYLNMDGIKTPDRRKNSIRKIDADGSFTLDTIGSGTLKIEESNAEGENIGVDPFQVKVTSDVSDTECIFLEATASGGNAVIEDVDADKGVIKVLLIVSSFPLTGDRTDTLLLVVTMIVSLLCAGICVAGIVINRNDSKTKKRNEKSSELWKRRID